MLHRILSCLNKIVVNLDILERTKIYKAVKTICKHSDINLQTKAGALIKKWKDMHNPEPKLPTQTSSETVELPMKHTREDYEETSEPTKKNTRHIRYVKYIKGIKLIIIDSTKIA